MIPSVHLERRHADGPYDSYSVICRSLCTRIMSFTSNGSRTRGMLITGQCKQSRFTHSACWTVKRGGAVHFRNDHCAFGMFLCRSTVNNFTLSSKSTTQDIHLVKVKQNINRRKRFDHKKIYEKGYPATSSFDSITFTLNITAH